VRTRALLALRSIFFVLLLPGTVAGYLPYRILRGAGELRPRPYGLDALSIGAGALFLAGVALLLRCVWDFAAQGRGTLAPIDPPRELVVRGPYRRTRNPMYNGVIAVLLGEAGLFRSVPLLEYALAIFVMFHLFVVLYEEPALASRFGDSYESYRRAVPRWGFARRAYEEPL
jgi:protein-S-isoprenylcysteine O-methyltransferase Ste14